MILGQCFRLHPKDYTPRDNQKLNETLRELKMPNNYVILPNSETLKDTREDQAISFT